MCHPRGATSTPSDALITAARDTARQILGDNADVHSHLADYLAHAGKRLVPGDELTHLTTQITTAQANGKARP